MTYTELHCHTHFSFLDGASAPDDLARRAAELAMPVLAVTDHQGLYGAVKFQTACRSKSRHVDVSLGVGHFENVGWVSFRALRPARMIASTRYAAAVTSAPARAQVRAE